MSDLTNEELAELASAFGNYTSGSGLLAKRAAQEIWRLREQIAQQRKISELDYYFAVKAYEKLRAVVPDDGKHDDHPLADLADDIAGYLGSVFDGQDWKAIRYHDNVLRKADERVEKAEREVELLKAEAGAGDALAKIRTEERDAALTEAATWKRKYTEAVK